MACQGSNLQLRDTMPAKSHATSDPISTTSGWRNPAVLPSIREETISFYEGCGATHCKNVNNNWLTVADGFLQATASLVGQAMWIAPPFSQVQKYLQHYLELKQQSEHTQACFLLPKWNAPWRPLLAGMHLLKTIPAGTVVYCDPRTGKPLKPIAWPLEVWADYPHSKVQLHSAASLAFGPSMTFAGTVNGSKHQFLLDSGATFSFWDVTQARLLGLPLQPALCSVEVADGHNVLCRHKCLISVHIGSYRETIWVHLIDLGDEAQVILGDDWLCHTAATLAFTSPPSCTIRMGDRTHSLVQIPQEAISKSHFLLSAVKFRKHLRNGGKFYVINVVDDRISPLTNPARPDWMEKMPKCSPDMQKLLYEYEDVFKPVSGCPPDRGINMEHVIPLIPNAKPHCRPMKRYSPMEMDAIEGVIKDLLDKDLIEPSTSPWGAAVVLALKKDGSIRPVVDWRSLNASTSMADRFPLPLQDQLFDQLSGVQYVSSLDLQSGYHQLLINKEDRYKTAFRTPFGHYQYKVLGQGLTNAPSCFMRVMNTMFATHLQKSGRSTIPGKPGTDCTGYGPGNGIAIYLDDILVYSRTREDHFMLVREVLQVLRDNQFQAKLSKCEFEQEEITFLGHVIGKHGIKPDPKKTSVVMDWPQPTSVSEVRSFLGLANYFRRFMMGYSTLAAPLTNLTKLDSDISAWNGACDISFQGIKDALCNAPTLALPDFTKPFEVVADASIVGIGAVLMQDSHPVAYLSKKLSPAEVNYITTDQELLAVLTALNEWRCYLEGAKHKFTIVSDHHPLTHLQTQPTLSRRQVRWVEILQRYDWIWQYRPGRINVADPLSRIPKVPLNRLHVHLYQATLRQRSRKPTPFQEVQLPPPPLVKKDKKGRDVPLVAAPPAHRPDPMVPSDPEALVDQLKAAYDQDPWFSESSNTSNLKFKEGIWWHGDKIAIPDNQSLKQGILYELHDAPYSGHPGRDHTLQAVQRLYWWNGLVKYVKQYVAACPHCQRNKSTNQAPAGLLHPLPVPEFPWQCISMDFISQLPKTSTGFDMILVVVCRLSKMVHIVPTVGTIGALGLATLYRDHVWKHHGVPLDMVSDRGKEFCNAFMQELFSLIGSKQKFSTAYHPQTDGQTERVNRVLEDMIRNYVGGRQDDWDQYLAAAEFAINNSYHDSIGTTPFRLCTGRDPNLPVTVAPGKFPKAAAFADQMIQGLADAKKCLEAARQRQKAYADKKRRHVVFNEGDLVLLSTKNINLRMPSDGTKKLLPRWIGPFPIATTKDGKLGKLSDTAYRLVLPAHMSRIHDVFHISLLKKYNPDGRAPPPVPMVEEGVEYFTIDRLLDHRVIKLKGKNRVKREYLVRWMDYPPEFDTWEQESRMLEISTPQEDGDELVLKYWAYTGLPIPPDLVKLSRAPIQHEPVTRGRKRKA